MTDTYTGKAVSDIAISVENHLIVFAAEKSRLENVIVDMEQYVADLSE